MFNYLNKLAPYTPEDATKFSTISQLLSVGLNILLGTGIAISLISIMLSGIKIMTSKGDPKAKDQAKESLTNSVIALLLTIGAFTAKIIIMNLLGADSPELRNDTPPF